ncbi:alkylated DNA repair protein AlkB [Phialophora macrospora]|uniref:mRNA N(6)-methyladenine demethylase n=1 Tax=Phialophora macrospora TaxID=1851006 RepID=A0A0D2D2N2_9EURO|nr:alkylated DNA repair protein AlkB [Phialophora macrospora]
MHDPHARPPDLIRERFKELRKLPASQIDARLDIVDPHNPDHTQVSALPDPELPGSSEQGFWSKEFGIDPSVFTRLGVESLTHKAFEINGLPGLQVFPCLLSPPLQIALLDKLLHRDLSNPVHKTNLHLHHHVRYPDQSSGSFFAAARDLGLQPKDPTVHKPITYAQMLESKLRWVTLGGQYDWTNKVYPDATPPPFPPDIAAFLRHLFPRVDAQAAIVNFYSPGDTLSVHRDVSEGCDRGLISISFGCDGIFLVGNEDGSNVALRLRSGDAILMSGASRYAWHGVPKILAGTCPDWLQEWPDVPRQGPHRQWRGWMNNKRINLNVRQMTEVQSSRYSSGTEPQSTTDPA